MKNNLHNVKSSKEIASLQTIGLLIDESRFFEKEKLVNELISNGIAANNIRIIVYRDIIKKNEEFSQPTFGLKHISWNMQFCNQEINDFINEKFDLLVSYYDVEKSFLLKVTQNSNAKFKVGFSTIDKRLNHLIINTNTENHTIFVHELFKYLKILKKI